MRRFVLALMLILMSNSHSNAQEEPFLDCRQTKNIEMAIKACSFVLKFADDLRDDVAAEMYFNRGNAYIAIGRYGRSLNDFNSALALKPNDPQILRHRGYTHVKLKDPRSALADFDAAVGQGWRGGGISLDIGEAFSDLGEYGKALQFFDLEIEENSNNSRAYYKRGLVKARMRDWDAAISDLNRGIELNPAATEAYQFRAIVKRQQKDISGAVKDMEKYLVLSGPDQVAGWQAQLKKSGHFDGEINGVLDRALISATQKCFQNRSCFN